MFTATISTGATHRNPLGVGHVDAQSSSSAAEATLVQQGGRLDGLPARAQGQFERSPLLGLPPEIQWKIADYLLPPDRVELSSTCKDLYDKFYAAGIRDYRAFRQQIYDQARAIPDLPSGEARQIAVDALLPQIEFLLLPDRSIVARQIAFLLRYLRSGAAREASVSRVYSIVTQGRVDEDMAWAAHHLIIDWVPRDERVAKFNAILGLYEQLISLSLMPTRLRSLRWPLEQVSDLPDAARAAAYARIHAMRKSMAPLAVLSR